VLAVARTAVLAPAPLAPVLAVARAAVLALAPLAPMLAEGPFVGLLLLLWRGSAATTLGLSREWLDHPRPLERMAGPPSASRENGWTTLGLSREWTTVEIV
jgi:hypothetical protein